MSKAWNTLRFVTLIISLIVATLYWTNHNNNSQPADLIDFGEHSEILKPHFNFKVAGYYTFTNRQEALKFLDGNYDPDQIDGQISFYCDKPYRLGNDLSLKGFLQLIDDCPSGYIIVSENKP